MADVLAVRDEYRAQTWAMFIQECNRGLTKREFCQHCGIFTTGSGNCMARWQNLTVSQLIPLDAPGASNDMHQIQYRGAGLKLLASVDIDAVKRFRIVIMSRLKIVNRSQIEANITFLLKRDLLIYLALIGDL